MIELRVLDEDENKVIDEYFFNIGHPYISLDPKEALKPPIID